MLRLRRGRLRGSAAYPGDMRAGSVPALASARAVSSSASRSGEKFVGEPIGSPGSRLVRRGADSVRRGADSFVGGADSFVGGRPMIRSSGESRLVRRKGSRFVRREPINSSGSADHVSSEGRYVCVGGPIDVSRRRAETPSPERRKIRRRAETSCWSAERIARRSAETSRRRTRTPRRRADKFVGGPKPIAGGPKDLSEGRKICPERRNVSSERPKRPAGGPKDLSEGRKGSSEGRNVRRRAEKICRRARKIRLSEGSPTNWRDLRQKRRPTGRSRRLPVHGNAPAGQVGQTTTIVQTTHGV